MNFTSRSATSAGLRARAAIGACAATTLIASSARAATASQDVATAMPLPNTLIVPRNLGYWAMFANASPIVQAVMIVLLLASVATWTIWLAKLFEVRSARRRLGADIRKLADTVSIEQAGVMSHSVSAQMLQAAHTETARSGTVRTIAAAEGLKDRVAAQVVAIEMNAVEHMTRGIAVLATVGAIAPFVGLFGTVWGIMTSFIGISESHTTNLAVVAPGIAEALLATAMGLVAAIPAVIMYNHAARGIAGFRNQLSNAATQVSCLLSHAVDAKF